MEGNTSSFSSGHLMSVNVRLTNVSASLIDLMGPGVPGTMGTPAAMAIEREVGSMCKLVNALRLHNRIASANNRQ